ncbi:MAG: helix-hairpin-helix domain-containing protein [Bacteroidales bacterium]
MLKSQSSIEQQEEWREVILERLDKESNQQDINNVIDRLYELINKPILINICSKEDLEELPFLSSRQIENLLYYRYVFGEMKSLHELRLVEDFDIETIRLVTPFLRVEPRLREEKGAVDKLFKSVRNEVVIRCDIGFNKKEGYVDKSDSLLAVNPNKHYLGSPLYSAVRYRLEAKDKLRAGLILEKDAGEKGLDYWNGFVQLKNRGVLKNLVAGSYKMRLGTGLVINNAFSLGKNQMGVSMMTRSNGIMPHASADEYNYLRGIAAEIKLSRYVLTAFWSYRSLDARIEQDTILSVKKDGLHNLLREEEKRNRADLISAGGALAVKGAWYQVGVNGVYHVFNTCYYPEKKLYNLHAFRGKRTGNISVDYRMKYAGLFFCGETAMSRNGAIALLHALTYQPASGITVTMLHRYYGGSYHSWFGRGYSEGSELNNESGVSFFLVTKPVAGLTVEGSADFFRFPWPKYGVDIPSAGYELRFQSSYQQGEKWNVHLRYRLKNRDKNRAGVPDSLPSVQCYQQHQIALRTGTVISASFFLKTSAEGTFYRFEGESASKGFLLSQSVGYKMKGYPLQADLMVALFDTENTQTKVYLSEKNVLYGFGIPSFYGNGMRTACTIRYDFAKRFTVWVKVANTRYFDRDEIGSGLELIRGKNKTDLWTQLQVKF